MGASKGQTSPEQANREFWSGMVRDMMPLWHEMLDGPRLEEDPDRTMDTVVYQYCVLALSAWLGGERQVATRLAERAVEAGHRALAEQRYRRLFFRWINTNAGKSEERIVDPDFRPTARQMAAERASGRMWSAQALHWAQWLVSGVRDWELWRLAIEAYGEYYQLHLRRGRDNTTLAGIGLVYIQGGAHQELRALYERDFRQRPGLPPKNKQVARGWAHALYLLNEYCLGREDLAEYARWGVQYAYNRHRNWGDPDPNSDQWDAVGWAWLHGKYITGVTDRVVILEGLRGY